MSASQFSEISIAEAKIYCQRTVEPYRITGYPIKTPFTAMLKKERHSIYHHIKWVRSCIIKIIINQMISNLLMPHFRRCQNAPGKKGKYWRLLILCQENNSQNSVYLNDLGLEDRNSLQDENRWENEMDFRYWSRATCDMRIGATWKANNKRKQEETRIIARTFISFWTIGGQC